LIAAAYLLLLGSPALLGWNALLVWALMLAGLGTVDQFLDLRGIRACATDGKGSEGEMDVILLERVANLGHWAKS